MQFSKFTSLDNTYRQNIVDRVVSEFRDDQTYVVTEKLDGANFAFYYDGHELKVASRNQFVDGTFFNCQVVINRYKEHIKYIYRLINSGYDKIIIRGELYGPNILKRVNYGELDFKVFEIMINQVIINFDTLYELLSVTSADNRENLSTVPLITYTSNLQEALEVNNTFRSSLTPSKYNKDNYAEGVCIHPNEPTWLHNGSRVWFKNKSDKFSEVKAPKKKKEKVELPENDVIILSKLLQYNTESRVYSTVSKLGNLTSKDFGVLLKEVNKDIIKDYNIDYGVSCKDEAVDYKNLTKQLNKEISTQARKVFVKVMKG